MESSTEKRVRFRQAGLVVGDHPTGPLNAITDVKNVRVGHVTVMDGDVNTGVTVVMPHEKNAARGHTFYGSHIHGCHSEMTGIQVLEDFGLMSSPIFLTNIMAVGRVYNGGITFGYSRGKGLPTNGGWPPIVSGIDDRFLNDLHQRVITEQHALEAIDKASRENTDEGAVGGGTGATAYGFKSGIGTSSRLAFTDNGTYRVGVLTLANHGRRGELVVNGVPIGKLMSEHPSMDNDFRSIIGIVATDGPVMPRQLDRMAERARDGFMRVGGLVDPNESCMIISFSTGIQLESRRGILEHDLEFLPDPQIAPLTHAAAEAAEESVLNALFKATTLEGRDGHVAEAIPIDRVIKILKNVRRD